MYLSSCTESGSLLSVVLGSSVTGEGAICSIAELEYCLEKHLYKKLPWFLGGFSAYKCNNGKSRKKYKLCMKN